MADGPFRLPHIVLPDISRREGFKPPPRVIPGRVPTPVADREIHAQTLLAQNRAVLETARAAIARRGNLLPATQNGFYLRVESRPDQPLLAEKFELKRNKGVELLTVTEDSETQKTAASLFVPEQASDFLERTLETYRTQLEPRGICGSTQSATSHSRVNTFSGRHGSGLAQPTDFELSREIIRFGLAPIRWFSRRMSLFY